MEKQTVREKILEMRRSLTSKDIEDASERVFEQITGMQPLAGARRVLVYSHFDNEIKTAKLTGWLLFQGKEVFLPTVEGSRMHAVNIKSAVLELSKFGVAQPKLREGEVAQPESIDLVIVPGVAFDRSKNRVGFGFGYYDRYLKQAKNAFRLAVAYDFQVVEKIDAAPEDERMDVILTPEFRIG